MNRCPIVTRCQVEDVIGLVASSAHGLKGVGNTGCACEGSQMQEAQRTAAAVGVVGAVCVFAIVLAWNIVAAFRHECRAAVGRPGCVVCGAAIVAGQ